MRIAIVGAGGQVAAEVVLLLAGVPEVELVPIVRTRSGSAFLRYHGIRVAHADIADRGLAPLCLAGAHVVANFALAAGSPIEARRQNEKIIRATFEYSDRSATIVFFSTLAVHGSVDSEGRWQRTAYGDLKLRNERLVASLARQRRRVAYILRLGHVAGAYQGLSEICREEILLPPVVIPDPERPSNVTHTVTIADALLAIGRGGAGPPDRYDLVNVPQWTWRQVYNKEAEDLGVAMPLAIVEGGSCIRVPLLPRLKRMLFKTVSGDGTKAKLLRLMAKLPGSFDQHMRAEYYLDRVSREIALLQTPPKLRNPATLWSGLEIRLLAGLARTEELFTSNDFSLGQRRGTRWPVDLMLD